MATKDGGTFEDVEILAGAPTLELRRVALSQCGVSIYDLPWFTFLSFSSSSVIFFISFQASPWVRNRIGRQLARLLERGLSATAIVLICAMI